MDPSPIYFLILKVQAKKILRLFTGARIKIEIGNPFENVPGHG
jgi:hypothetical protein